MRNAFFIFPDRLNIGVGLDVAPAPKTGLTDYSRWLLWRQRANSLSHSR